MSIKFQKRAGFLLALFFPVFLYAQETDHGTAEAIFDDYHKIGIITGLSILYVTNEPNAIDYKYHNTRAFNLGLNYNFYQAKDFNFKASIIYRTYKIVSESHLTEEKTGYFDSWTKIWFGPFSQFRVGLTAEYYIPINKTFSLSIGLGPEFAIYPANPTSGLGLYHGGEVDGVGYTEKGNNKNGWLYIGVNASIGLNIQVGPLLLQPTFTYHYQPETLYTNVVTTQKLKVPNTVSTHTITGNYIMFGLSISPSRDLFRGKKEKKSREDD